MPNIVLKWDFEDGTTQGWSLGSKTSLDSSSALQGTYSLKYAFSNLSSNSYTDLVASISNIDLSTVSKPILVIMFRDNSPSNTANYPQRIRVIVKDSTTTYVDLSVQTAYNINNYYRVAVFDLSPAAGKSGLTIQIYENSYSYCVGSVTVAHYYDNIMILDGADYEYNTGVIASDADDKTITLSVPSADGDLSTITASKVAVSLMTPDWDYKNVSVTFTHNQGSLGIDSTQSSGSNYQANYASYSTAPTSFQSVSMRVWGWSIGAYVGWYEKVAVAILDASWNLLRLYVFNIYFTANGVSPRFVNAVTTATYGTLVSGNKSFNVRIYGNAFDVALRVKYIYGDRTVVTSGTVTLEVFSSDLSTRYGGTSVDITTANDQVTSYITGLPTNTNLVIRVSWTIQANARIVLLAYPLLRVY